MESSSNGSGGIGTSSISGSGKLKFGFGTVTSSTSAVARNAPSHQHHHRKSSPHLKGSHVHHSLFHHSRSFEQSGGGGSQETSNWTRLSDGGGASSKNTRVASFQQQSKGVLLGRSLSEEDGGGGGQGKSTPASASTTSTPSTEKKPPVAGASYTREQAIKYYAAFPALSGKFPTGGGGASRSASVTRPSTISSLSSPRSTTASAKMSAQSSLDDSVFGEESGGSGSNSSASGGGPSSGGGDHQQPAGWNGLKIIKNISKANVVGAMTAAAAETGLPLGVNGTSSSTAVVGVVATKPPTLSGKNRVIVAAAPSSLLLDASGRDWSGGNFTTLKKKKGNSSMSSSATTGRKTSSSSATSSTSSGAEAFDGETSTKHRSAPSTASNLATMSTSSGDVVGLSGREQEKIYNIMPAFLNPTLKSGVPSSSKSTSSATSTTTTSTTSVAGTTLNRGKSSSSTSTSNGPAKISSTSSTLTSTSTNRRPRMTTTAGTASCCEAAAGSGATIVDLLPSFLKSHQSQSGEDGGVCPHQHRQTAAAVAVNSALSAVEVNCSAPSAVVVTSSCTTTSEASQAATAFGYWLDAAAVMESTSSTKATAAAAYQQHPRQQQREVIRSAPTTRTTSHYSQPSTASHHLAASSQRNSDWRTTTSIGPPSAKANVITRRASVQSSSAVSAATVATTPATSSKMLIATTSTATTTTTIASTRYGPPAPALIQRSLSTTSIKATSASTASTTTSITDYDWFNFTEDTDEDSAGRGGGRRPEGAGQLVNTTEDDAGGLASNCRAVVEKDFDAYKSTTTNESHQIEEESQQPATAPTAAPAPAQLVIDSKGALDEWMNSIRAQQKQRQQKRQKQLAKGTVPPLQPPSAPEPRTSIPKTTTRQQSAPSITTRSSGAASPTVTASSSSSASSMQAFLDSISQSFSEENSSSTLTNSSWRPLASMAREVEHQHPKKTAIIDPVSYYWKQNCTLGYLDFVEEGGVSEGGTSSNTTTAVDGRSNKTFQQYLEEQVLVKSEISMLAELFAQSQASGQCSAMFSGHTLASPGSSTSSSNGGGRISLANHEAESSAFQEVASATNRSDLLVLLADREQAAKRRQHLVESEPEPPPVSYFTPIEAPELIDSGEVDDWAATLAMLQQHPDQLTSTTTSRTAPTLKHRQVTATANTTTSNSSTAASRSISQSRAELDTYFTPELSTCSGGTEGSALRGGPGADDQTTFYSSSNAPTTCPSRETSASVPPMSTTNTNTTIKPPEKLSNSACACKTACTGHFVESACCCYPNEYHCRLGSDREDSPLMMRMCDKSTTTTTTTDQLLDAVNATLLDSLFKSYHQQHNKPPPPPLRSNSCQASPGHRGKHPITGRLVAAAGGGGSSSTQHLVANICSTAEDTNTTSNSMDSFEKMTAADLTLGGDFGDVNFNGDDLVDLAASDLLVDDDDELDVTNLVNDVLRLTIAERSLESKEEELALPPKSNTPATVSTATSTHSLLDDFDGPPMPYSKRKKYLNDRSKPAYGQFPITFEQVEELRRRAQAKAAAAAAAAAATSFFEPKRSGRMAINTKPVVVSSSTTLKYGVNSITSSISATTNASTTVYYSNRSNNSAATTVGSSLFDFPPTASSLSPVNSSPPLTTESHGEVYEACAYADATAAAFYPDDDSTYDLDGLEGSAPGYVIGPDGAQYYVGGRGGGLVGEDDGLDGGDIGGGGGSGTGHTYSPEELYAQYGADAYAVMNAGDVSGHLDIGAGAKDSLYPMFDLKFKTSNRTIDNTIETTGPKQSQKPCTFYMEGFCARGDCKFSHDLSSITCKYWLEGFCIKEDACPFLHGFADDSSNHPPPAPVETSKLDPNAKSFQFKIESDFDFPALAGEDEDSGYGLEVASDQSTVGLSAADSLHSLFFNGGGGSGSSTTGYRVNFLKPKTRSNKANGMAAAASTTNGHYSRPIVGQQAMAAAAEEEWPSLNGYEAANGMTANINSSTKDEPITSSFPDRLPVKVNFREKVIKSKKGKYGGGRATTGSGAGSTNSTGNSTSSPSSKFTLKGLL